MDEELIGDLRAECQVLEGALADCSDQDWQRLTPAQGWTVADSVRHLVVSDRAAVLAITKDLDPLRRRRRSSSRCSSEAPALLAAWRRSREEVAEAFDRLPTTVIGCRGAAGGWRLGRCSSPG